MNAALQANQALLHGVRRLNAGKHLVGDQTCIVHSALGIDPLTIGSAPERELVWVYVYTDHPDTFCLLSFAAYLGITQPLIEAAMEFVTVLKYGHQPLEILPLVPSHADGLNLLAHVTTPCFDDELVTVTDRMSPHHVINWLTACLIALLFSSTYLLDGPSEIEAAQAVSGDVQDAIKSVAANAHIERASAEIQHETFAMVKP